MRIDVIDTKDPAARAEWGVFDGVIIEGHPLRYGPPPKLASIEKKLRKAVRKKGLV